MGISFLYGMCTGAILTWLFIWVNTGRKRRGFTDRMYIFNVIFVSITVIVSFVAIFQSGKLDIRDLSPISAIIPAAFGELAIHTGFIIWKAKVENCRKNKDVNRLNSLESEVDT